MRVQDRQRPLAIADEYLEGRCAGLNVKQEEKIEIAALPGRMVRGSLPTESVNREMKTILVLLTIYTFELI